MDNIREEMEKRRIEKRKKRQRIVLIQRSILTGSALLVVVGVMFLFSRLNTEDGLEETVGVSQQVTQEDGGQAPETEQAQPPERSTPSNAEEMQPEPDTTAPVQEEERKDGQAAIDAYDNLGIANVSDYLNIRETPEEGSRIIGRLPSGAGCEIMGTEDGWHHIVSGKADGYVQSQYMWTGEEAREYALENLQQKAVITADQVNIRREPVIDTENIVGAGVQGEQFDVISQEDGWIQTPEGYLAVEHAEIRLVLKEAIVQ